MQDSLSRTVLVVIDPQNCFMDLPGAPLPVKGATADMDRLGAFIEACSKEIDAIKVSMDTHLSDHISHACRWINASGDHPAPFTIITADDYERGVWRATDPRDQAWQGEYLRRLTRPHVIWPTHGQKGSWEWWMYDGIFPYLTGFANNCVVVEKGMHRDTEQFGIFGADVPFPGAQETEINRELIDEINAFDRVIFAGEASSHCVMDSVNQFLAHIPPTDWSKVVLLEDCMSPVPGFEDTAAAWLKDMRQKGLRITTSTEFTVSLPLVQ